MTEALKRKLKLILSEQDKAVVAIDGMSAAGKTTLADVLAKEFSGAVIHLDDYFLPPEMKTSGRLSSPGGNTHYERFLEEVITPVTNGLCPRCRRYDCSTGELSDFFIVRFKRLLLLEGVYSMRPEFRKIVDFSIFMEISESDQLERLRLRAPDKVYRYLNEWIPLEKQYFEHYCIRETCNTVILT